MSSPPSRTGTTEADQGPTRLGPPHRPALAGQIRIGQGFDAHAWSDDPTRPLVLGGVTFDDARGLRGHSDADVIAHALTDAVLGAAGLGDIGSFFPDTDPQFAGADSLELLAVAMDAVWSAGWQLINADCTVIADRPRLSPVRDRMQDELSRIVGGHVSVKGKTTEGLPGLQGGIQCHAVALCCATDQGRDVEIGSAMPADGPEGADHGA